jgi:hypothetical protein
MFADNRTPAITHPLGSNSRPHQNQREDRDDGNWPGPTDTVGCRWGHGSSGQFAGGTGHGELSFVPMAKTPTKIEVMQEGDERFLLMTFADGSEVRKPIVKLPRKPPRFPYRRVTFDKSRKKGF